LDGVIVGLVKVLSPDKVSTKVAPVTSTAVAYSALAYIKPKL